MKAGTSTPIRSPIKWAGGKSRLRKLVVAMLPDDHSCYVEPFGGAAWVLFAKPRSDVEVYNDLHGELVNFFKVVRDKPKEFIQSFKWELVSREIYEELAQTSPAELSDLERAHRFFYLIMAGWGGESSYYRFQTSIKDGGHGNRLIGALKTLENRITRAHERLKTVIIEHLPWEEVLDKYDSKQTVFYLDPPYPGNGVNYGLNMKDLEEHKLLWEALASLSGKWVLSTYDKPHLVSAMREVIGGDMYIYPVQSYSGMRTSKEAASRVRNAELLVTNYPATEEFLKLAPSAAPKETPLF